MKRQQTSGSAFDISIDSHELEHSRRQLEVKLKYRIPEPVISLASDEGDYTNIEYPPRDTDAIPYPEFPSFAHRSGRRKLVFRTVNYNTQPPHPPNLSSTSTPARPDPRGRPCSPTPLSTTLQPT